MKALFAAAALLCLSGCAGPIAAWKGRAYGEHTLEPNELITMSSTFRNARTGTKSIGNPPELKTVVCFEPHSEVAALMGGSSSAGYSEATLEDDATPVLVKGHEPSGVVQLAALHHSIACNAWLDGILENEEYKARTNELLNALVAAMTPAPAKPADK